MVARLVVVALVVVVALAASSASSYWVWQAVTRPTACPLASVPTPEVPCYGAPAKSSCAGAAILETAAGRHCGP
jgi:hypothetical protein